MKQKWTFVPGVGIPSVILMVVVLCMSVLAVLAFVSARNDKALADRSAEVATSVYTTEAAAERTLSQIDAILKDCQEQSGDAYLTSVAGRLPGGVLLDAETGIISWTEQDGGRTLICEIEVLPAGEGSRYRWVKHTLLAETEEEITEDELWN